MNKKSKFKDSYPEVGEASILLFKAFQRSLKLKDSKKIQNCIGYLYKLSDSLVELIGG